MNAIPDDSIATGPVPPGTLIHKLESIIEPLDFSRMFARAQPLEIELGSGDGSFLAAYARRHPERNFLGVERLLGRLRKLDRKGRRAGLANLRLVSIEAAYFLRYLVPAESAAAVHVYFPDPWPKRRHRRNRLINEEFPAIARRVLSPGGVVYLRTDDADYFTQMRRVFATATGFETTETPAELREVVTDFERGFNAQGIATNYAAHRRVG
jgi:tRNA (guanine-N7-)-methyltransferase